MKNFMRDTRGANAVEFAIIFPAFVVVLSFIVYFGELLWVVNTINYAVEDAARCGAIDTKTCGTAGQIQALASDRSQGLVQAGDFVVTTGPTCVSTQYTFQPIGISFPFKACDA